MITPLLKASIARYEELTGESKKLIFLCNEHLEILKKEIYRSRRESRQLLVRGKYLDKFVVREELMCMVCRELKQEQAIKEELYEL